MSYQIFWTISIAFITLCLCLPYALKKAARAHGRALSKATRNKRRLLMRSTSETGKQIIIGFFHPYCNAGGGGERVLWSAIRTIQNNHADVFCVVYTGDTEASQEGMIRKAFDVFGIKLDHDRVAIIHLHKRHIVSAERWPRLTLLGQSVGSMVLAYEAMTCLSPDIYIDTMGYAFTYPLIRYLLDIPIATYTHYPTISDDMLNQHPKPFFLKLAYWKAFRALYCIVGGYADFVVANSTWTMGHLTKLWQLSKHNSMTIFPPCDTVCLSNKASGTEFESRDNVIICVAQFRPEKRHDLLLRAFAKFCSTSSIDEARGARLICAGSVRSTKDTDRVQWLQSLSADLGISDRIAFKIDVPWPKIRELLCSASIGTNAMWNEHFGIGVVEYMAAGLICVVHASGGPLLDIVTPYDDKQTGYHATDVDTFARCFEEAFALSPKEKGDMRRRAIMASARFSEEVFDANWASVVQQLLRLRREKLLVR